jgi:transcription factor SPN1
MALAEDDLHRKIFGGSDDDDDLSSEEEGGLMDGGFTDARNSNRRRRLLDYRPLAAQQRRIDQTSEFDDGEEEGDREPADEDYDHVADGEDTPKLALPKFKKRKPLRQEDDEEMAGASTVPRRRKRRERLPAGDAGDDPAPEVDMSPEDRMCCFWGPSPSSRHQLSPLIVRRYNLNKAIDAAARSGRSQRIKKRKKGDEDVGETAIQNPSYLIFSFDFQVLDAAADEEVKRVKFSMEVAVMEDQEANSKGKPALAKLKILQSVTDVLQKCAKRCSDLDSC